MQSPVVYLADPDFVKGFKNLMTSYYSPRQCMYHYLHMAKGNIREYLKGERVWTKKYFYVLRPLLACRWIEACLGVVPMEFQKLVDNISCPPDIRVVIHQLLTDKIAGREMDDGPRIDIFHKFFESELVRLDQVIGSISVGEPSDYENFDKLFQSIIMKYSGSLDDR